jgi:4-diphosphocytidyl-2-C-methyl-D-erythritol kinase
MTTSLHARILAPAKINLGLEILGRSEDGFHEIRSVMAMVDLFDDIRISVATDSNETTIDGVPGVPVRDNLILRAVSGFSARVGLSCTYDVRVVKRIPAPAGLGGASSNAAATLLALNTLHGSPLDAGDLHALASELGSDVPFFLGTPVAAVSGRGTELTPLPSVRGWVLIAIPRIDVTGKTSTLYRMLTSADFSDGSNVQRIVRMLKDGHLVDPHMLHNAFERPLRALAPATSTLAEQMRSAGCLHVALSGAGPAHYALFNDPMTAHRVKGNLRSLVDSSVTVVIAPFKTEPVTVELV